MTDAQRLTWVRAIHTVIYVVMATSVFVVLYAGLTGAHGSWLWVALGLVAVETVVFAVSGMKCPLSAVAEKYGARKDALYDTFLPERITRHTFTVFAPLIVLGAALLITRWWFGWT